MPRLKTPKPVRYRLRRQSYIKNVTADAVEWLSTFETSVQATIDRGDIVKHYLQQMYNITTTSSRVRKINGDKINRSGMWRVRVDYMLAHDKKLFLMFALRYSPVLIDKSWFNFVLLNN